MFHDVLHRLHRLLKDYTNSPPEFSKFGISQCRECNCPGLTVRLLFICFHASNEQNIRHKSSQISHSLTVDALGLGQLRIQELQLQPQRGRVAERSIL